MLENIISESSNMTFTTLICLGTALLLGLIVALTYMVRSTYSKSFVITLALLPAMVETVILLVNGNLGVGVAVMGAFSLVRFRSVPGSAKEIATIFWSMVAGLACGTGYVVYAAVFTVVIAVMMLLYTLLNFGEGCEANRTLRITIPEDLDYADVFNDLFAAYARNVVLERVQTTNLGSLYELKYSLVLKDVKREKEMLDKIRQRNGNLTIVCGKAPEKDEM